jgi:hypothetical protein
LDSWSIEEALDYCLANPDGLSAAQLLAKFPQHSAELQPLLALQPGLAQLASIEPPPVSDARREAMKSRIQAAAQAASTTLPHQTDKVVPSAGAQTVAARRPVTQPQPKVEDRRPWWQAILRRPAVAVPVGALVLLLLIWWGAAGSLPDSPLYSVKISSENLMLKLSGSDESRARTHLNLASARVADIEAMIRRNRLAEAEAALENFGYHIDRCSILLVDGASSARPELEPRLGQVMQDCDGVIKSAGLDMSSLPEGLRNRIAALYGTMGAASRRVNLTPPELPAQSALPVVTPTPLLPTPTALTPSVTALAIVTPSRSVPLGSPTAAAVVPVPSVATAIQANPTATSQNPPLRPPAPTWTQPQRRSATAVPPTIVRPTQVRPSAPTRAVQAGTPARPTATSRPAPPQPTATPRPPLPTPRPSNTPALPLGPPPVQPSSTRTPVAVATATSRPTDTVAPLPTETATPEPPEPTDTIEPPPPPTRGAPRTVVPDPPPPTATTPAAQTCALNIDEVELECVGNPQEIRWSMAIENSSPDPVAASWTAELMVLPAQGGWQRVDVASDALTVPPGGASVGGVFSYEPPAGARRLRVRVTLNETGLPECRSNAHSDEIDPCEERGRGTDQDD